MYKTDRTYIILRKHERILTNIPRQEPEDRYVLPERVLPPLQRENKMHSDLSHLATIGDLKQFFESMSRQSQQTNQSRRIAPEARTGFGQLRPFKVEAMVFRVESFEEPVFGRKVVSRGKHSAELVVGADGILALRWNWMGNFIVYEFNQSKSAEYEVERGYGWMRLKWTNLRAVGFSGQFWCKPLCPADLQDGIRMDYVDRKSVV